MQNFDLVRSPETVVCHSILLPNAMWQPPANLHARKDGKDTQLPVIPRHIQQISILVPVFREFSNGNLARLIEALQKQNTDLSQVTLILVVNNSIEIAKDVNHRDRIENLASIAWLKKMQAKVGFRIQIEDHATEGIEKNMGVIRNRAFAAALRTSKATPDHHLMIHLDADTVLPDDYVAKLKAYYQTYPLDAVYTVQKYRVRDGDNVGLLRTHYRYVFDLNKYHFIRVMEYAQRDAGTPQITHMATALSKVGGFKNISWNEDFYMAANLSQLTYAYVGDVYNIVEDRSRAEGFEAAARHQWIDLLKKDERYLAPYKAGYQWPFIGNYLYSLDKKIGAGKISTTEALQTFDQFLSAFCGREITQTDHNAEVYENLGDYSLDPKYCALSFVYKWYEAKLLQNGPHFWAARLVLLLNVLPLDERSYFSNRWLAEIELHNAAMLRRQDAVREWVENKKVPRDQNDDPFITIVARAGGQVAGDLAETYRKNRKNEALTAAEALQMTYMRYGDWLLEYAETPFKQDVVAQEVLMEAFLLAQNQPDRFPALAKLLAKIRP